MEYLRSLREFVPKAVNEWATAVLTAVSLLLWVLQGVGVSVPKLDWFRVFLISIIVAMFLAFHRLRVERDKLKKFLEPKFDLVFSPKYTLCREEREWDDNDGTHVIDRLFRLGVKNLSGVTVPNLRMLLREIQPQPKDFIPTFVREMHGTPPFVMTPHPPYILHPGSRGLDAEPGMYFDVVRKRSAGNGSGYISLQNAVHVPRNEIPPGRYVFTIRAEGDNAPAVVRQFSVWVDTQGVLQFDNHNGLMPAPVLLRPLSVEDANLADEMERLLREAKRIVGLLDQAQGSQATADISNNALRVGNESIQVLSPRYSGDAALIEKSRPSEDDKYNRRLLRVHVGEAIGWLAKRLEELRSKQR